MFTKERLLGHEEEMKRYPALRLECILSWDYLQKVDAILKKESGRRLSVPQMSMHLRS